MIQTTLCYLKRDGKTLLLHRNKRSGDIHTGKYVGLGGKMEAGETPHACMVREVQEESGFRVNHARLRGFIDWPAFDGVQDVHCWIYTASDFEGELKENEEGSLHWIRDEEILDYPCWEGDRIFLPWLEEDPFFEATFFYQENQYRSYQLREGIHMNPIIDISLQGNKHIKVELYRDIAPKTVDNFLKLVQEKFYDGLIFHRIIKGFMIQGGCPEGTGRGGPGWTIEGEFRSNGVENHLRHEKGVISMARSMSPNSAGSQFFIMHEAAPHLDGQYAAFGRVVEGLEWVDELASVKTGTMDRPLQDQVIEGIHLLPEQE